MKYDIRFKEKSEAQMNLPAACGRCINWITFSNSPQESWNYSAYARLKFVYMNLKTKP